MKLIQLTQGKVAMVDDEDYEKTGARHWTYRKTPSGTEYAQMACRNSKGGKTTVSMQRFILGLTDPNVLGAHIDGNGLNNQKSNLRATTWQGNKQSIVRKSKAASSRYRGVVWSKESQVWRATVKRTENGIRRDYYLGGFKTEEAAALAWNEKAKELGYFPEALNQIVVGLPSVHQTDRQSLPV